MKVSKPKQKRDYLERFHRMREAMGWSWEDLSAITGLKDPFNSLRRHSSLPRWAILAVRVHERLAVPPACSVCHVPRNECTCDQV